MCHSTQSAVSTTYVVSPSEMIEFVHNVRVTQRIERIVLRWSSCHPFALGNMDSNHVTHAVIIIVVMCIAVVAVFVSCLVGQRGCSCIAEGVVVDVVVD
jgi:hypothetical protein